METTEPKPTAGYAYSRTGDRKSLPPDWRWERARWLVANGKAPSKKDDLMGRAAYAFRKSLVKADTDAKHLALAKRAEWLYEAWNCRESSSDTSPTKYVIEAYLCSGASYDQIGAKMCLSPKTIAYYEKVFFNVKDKLEHPMYMVSHVFGQAVKKGVRDNQPDLLWKLFGYLLGPVFLESLIMGCDPQRHITESGEADEARRLAIRSSLGVKSLIAARTVPVYGNEQLLLEQYNRMIDIENQKGNAGAPAIVANIQSVVSQLGFSRTNKTTIAENGSDGYDTAYELRAHEKVFAAIGEAPPQTGPRRFSVEPTVPELTGDAG